MCTSIFRKIIPGTLLILSNSQIALASVESTLAAIQTKLISTLLPLCAIIGIALGAFSFFSGNPNGKNHVVLAVIGAAVGFGAPSIIALIRSLVH